jgi:hypothetical protein
MSTGDADRVRVFETADDSSSRRPPSGFVLLAVGLLIGMAVGVLFLPSGASNRQLTEPSVITTAQLPPISTTSTTATTDPSVTVDGLQGRIRVLESELERAEARVLELGLEVDPVQYAPVVGCDARQQAFGAELDSYFVGPVGFWFPSQDLSGEGEEAAMAVWTTVEAGDSVTLAVPDGERDRYSLLWNPATWQDGHSGEPAVTLEACDARFPTVFVGGFAGAYNSCAPLDVYFGNDPQPTRVIFSLGNVDCPDGPTPLELPEPGPVPDVIGLTVRQARTALRLVGLVPIAEDGDRAVDRDGIVFAQEPNDGRTYEPGTIIGMRTCRAANHVVATYQSRLEGTGVTLSNGWMAPSGDKESWWFVSALVSGGSNDGQVATWALPAFGGGVDSVNTPNLSFPANEVSQSFDFGDRRFTPDDYGVTDWLDLDGAIASQQCVTISNDR